MFRINALLHQGPGYYEKNYAEHHFKTSQIISNNMSTSSKGIELSVLPLSCLHDEPVSIRVNGLLPDQDVTLMASMKDVSGVHFMSHAHYRADNHGQVDVDVMESLGGQYEGVFPMGLIGSLLPAPSEYKYTRFVKRDVENPNLVTVSVYDGHLSAESLCSPEVSDSLASIHHERHYMAPGVQRIPVCYGKVRGCLFLPPGDGPFPAVVDLFTTAGGLLEYRSAQLASRGFASLTLAFFNYDDLPKGLKEFDIAYFEEAVEFLLKHDKVLPNGIGVVATSKRGGVAAAMAAFIPSVIACVTINTILAPISESLRVEDHVYTPVWVQNQYIHMSDDGVMSMKHAALSRREIEKHLLPIEKSRAAFLFLVSIDDYDIQSEFQAQIACSHLAAHNYKNTYEVVAYPGAGHLLEPPYSPHCYGSFIHSFAGVLAWGGNAKHHIIGEEKAWKKLRNFMWFHLVENTKNKNCHSDYLKSQI